MLMGLQEINSPPALSVAESEVKLGGDLRALRLSKNLGQRVVAERAGVSEKAVRRLEAGQGSTLSTLIAVLGVLGRESWLESIAPVASINPLTMPTRGTTRERATARFSSSRLLKRARST